MNRATLLRELRALDVSSTYLGCKVHLRHMAIVISGGTPLARLAIGATLAERLERGRVSVDCDFQSSKGSVRLGLFEAAFPNPTQIEAAVRGLVGDGAYAIEVV